MGAADASLTPASGVVAVAELVGRLGVIAALDDAVGGIKQRDRGLSAGEFLVSLAQAQMLGGGFWTCWTIAAPMWPGRRCRRWRPRPRRRRRVWRPGSARPRWPGSRRGSG